MVGYRMMDIVALPAAPSADRPGAIVGVGRSCLRGVALTDGVQGIKV